MAAVPRYLQLEMRPAPARSVPPAGTTAQPLVLVRDASDERPYKVKLRLEYAVGGRAVVEDIVSGNLEPPPPPPPTPPLSPHLPPPPPPLPPP
eukprot:2454991-Prymnesium_polylepis.1